MVLHCGGTVWHGIKKCISLDLKTEQGRGLVKELLKTADIVVENFRPGVLEEWGLDPESLRAGKS